MSSSCGRRESGLVAVRREPSRWTSRTSRRAAGASPGREGLPVMFVRHALPGERVVARVTEVTSKFARADAVEILRGVAGPGEPRRARTPAPAAAAAATGSTRRLPAQRALKAAVDRPAAAAPRRASTARSPSSPCPAIPDTAAPGAAPGLGWRTRVQFAVGPDGVAGPARRTARTRSIDIGDCLIAHQGIRDLDIPGARLDRRGRGRGRRRRRGRTGQRGGHRHRRGASRHGGPAARRAGQARPRSGRVGCRTRAARSRAQRTLVEGRGLPRRAGGRARLAGERRSGFWQVHPAAADTLSEAVIAALAPKPGDTVLDLYCGAGLFAGAVAAAGRPRRRGDRDRVRPRRGQERQAEPQRPARGCTVRKADVAQAVAAARACRRPGS